MSFALQRSRASIGIVPMAVALFAALVMGGAVGYEVKGVSVSSPSESRVSVSACAPGSHPVVWYSVKAWACVYGQQ